MRVWVAILGLLGWCAGAATPFVCIIRPSGDAAGDYPALSTWESAQQADYDLASTKVFGGTKTGSPSGTLTLYRGGASQSVTATYKYITVAGGQLLVTGISDTAFSYSSGDEWRMDASNLFTITNWDSAIPTAKIEGTWTTPDTGTLTISGWTTTNTTPIIVTNSASKHDGKRLRTDTGAFWRSVTNANGISLVEEHVRIYGIQQMTTVSGSSAYLGISLGGAAGSIQYVADCILQARFTDPATVVGSVKLYSANDADVTAYVWNTIAYGANGTNTANNGFRRGSGTCYAYNNTAVSNYINYSGSMIATNCLSQNAVNDGFNGVSTGDYNCSDLASDAPGGSSVNSYNVEFVSEVSGSEDFHTTSANTSIIGAGLDNPTSLFATDIDGDTRSDWDIGADEYIAPASGSGFGVIVITTQ